ncbi:MAG: DPP IV N-terminal domain-containing protein [Acidimicrobiales bacterium]|nr:DPP IV N-terminal domain-containing protein [Acidimicrobiales bacterium]
MEVPSGRLVFSSDRSGNLDLWLLEAGSDDPRQLTTDERWDRDPTFVPDATAVLFQSDRVAGPDSPTGLRSYGLYRFDLDTDEVTHLLGSRTYNSGPSLTPDGSTLSFASDASGEMHIYFADPDGSSARQITEENRSNGGPVWSPDGTSAVYSTRSGSDDWDLWIMDADGDNRRALLDGPENDKSADWSPDGQQLVFQSDRDGGEGAYDLFVLDIDTGEVTALTSGPGNDQFPTWSPDGRHVAFDSDRDDTGEVRTRTNVYLVEVDTGDVARLTDGDSDSFPDWGP